MSQPIGITLGEPWGVGPELLLRTFSHFSSLPGPVTVFGNSKLLKKWASRYGLPFPHPTNLTFEDVPCSQKELSSFSVEERGQFVLSMLEQASQACQKGILSCLVTGPIDKSVVRSVLSSFTGHTEYLAEKAGVQKSFLCMDNGEVRIALLTNHVPLREVPQNLSRELLEKLIRMILTHSPTWFGIPSPKIVVAGLNPHAGETTRNAEEKTIFQPVIQKLSQEGISLEGPLAADSIFPLARRGKWDVVICPFHDQGLIAAKYSGWEKVVNITLGLPYLRISPGHGVAYDKVGKLEVDVRCFERALRIAWEGRLVP